MPLSLISTEKLYCFVDETGPDTEGAFFLVVVVLKQAEDLQFLKEKLEEIEKSSNKKLKWSKSSFKTRALYLNQLVGLKLLKNAVYYSTYQDTKAYISLTALTIAKVILSKESHSYSVNILIDGLKKKEMEEVRKELKQLKINYNRIRGLKDEQDIVLRLADAIAGFLRDDIEGQEYTKSILKKFHEAKIINEV